MLGMQEQPYGMSTVARRMINSRGAAVPLDY